jgi:hypothetical protein
VKRAPAEKGTGDSNSRRQLCPGRLPDETASPLSNSSTHQHKQLIALQEHYLDVLKARHHQVFQQLTTCAPAPHLHFFLWPLIPSANSRGPRSRTNATSTDHKEFCTSNLLENLNTKRSSSVRVAVHIRGLARRYPLGDMAAVPSSAEQEIETLASIFCEDLIRLEPVCAGSAILVAICSVRVVHFLRDWRRYGGSPCFSLLCLPSLGRAT